MEVPATLANLGAGYDCLGLALEIVKRTEVEPLPDSGASMRAFLPLDVPLADAAADLGRVALGVAGLSQGRPEALTPSLA